MSLTQNFTGNITFLNQDAETLRQKLKFYQDQKERALQNGAENKKVIANCESWIEIYTARLQKLEKHILKLGVKTQAALH